MTVPDGAPKHIEWGDRMAQALQVLTSDIDTTRRLAQLHPDAFRVSTLMDVFRRINNALVDLDQVRDEIINSNLEKVVRSLAEASPDICDERSSGAMYNVDLEDVLAAKKLMELWADQEASGG